MRFIFLFLLAGMATCDEPKQSWTAFDRKFLFVGNSLTYSNELPEIFRALAKAAAGEDIGVATVAFPDFSLEDHWYEGTASRLLNAHQFEQMFVQQGPSATGQNPLHLKHWTRQFKTLAEAKNTGTIVFTVWPSSQRMFDLNGVIAAYQTAADSSGARLAPAGAVWKRIWEILPGAPLYSLDGFHPSMDGSWVAAMTMVCVVFEVNPEDVPSEFLFYGRTISINEPIANAARTALSDVLGREKSRKKKP